MPKNQNTIEKRQREMEKKRKAEEKRKRKQLRKDQSADDPPLCPATDGDSDGSD